MEYFRNISHISNSPLSLLKINKRNPRHKYKKINLPHKFWKITDNLSEKSNIRILRQYKGRGVVIMENCKHIDKYPKMLKTVQEPF